MTRTLDSADDGHAARTIAYRSRSIRTRHRRSTGELAHLLDAVQGLLIAQSGPISIRHLFYLVVSAGLIEKTERAYANLKHLLSRWRRPAAIEWDAFADSTRWRYGHPGYAGPEAFLTESIRLYRYGIWTTLPVHVEIWCEKDAIASILLDAADTWRVQVFPFRGYTSLTSLYNAGVTFEAKQRAGKQVYVYFFGDHDPSGVDIDRAAQAALRDDFGIEHLTFVRVAVTAQQIAEYALPTRPTKASDSRARGFVGQSVEIDAMPREVLLDLVEASITQHLPKEALARMRTTEAAQRETLDRFQRAWTRRRGGRADEPILTR